MKNKLTVLALMLGAAGLATSAAHAQEKVKIGFITDMSSLYSDVEGKNGALAIQMAIDDFGGKVLGQPIEMIALADRAQQRLHRRFCRLVLGKGKPTQKVVTALARELAGFLWAALHLYPQTRQAH